MPSMQLKALCLRNFRNYIDELVYFSPGINVLFGRNAQGKTNLLEAICVLMTGRSFRTPHLSDLIRFGEKEFFLEAHFVRNDVEQVLKISSDGIHRKILLNSTPLNSLSALLGILMGVILSPEDHELVKGQPASRRHYLDLQIAKVNPLYLHHLSRYTKALKYRNHLLRKRDLSTLHIWEEELATSGAFITLERLRATAELDQQGHPFQKALSLDADALQIRYQSSALLAAQERPLQLKEHFLAHYHKIRPREIERGSTLVGPHRDDLLILLQSQDIRSFASEGQQRSCVAALRLAEWCRLQDQADETPLMCIDDVGISLDRFREKSLYDILSQLGQVFVTSPRDELPLPSDVLRIEVENGHFSCAIH